jgi:hypothetical protein
MASSSCDNLFSRLKAGLNTGVNLVLSHAFRRQFKLLRQSFERA